MSNCKLKKKEQLWLLELFVLEVKVQQATSLMGLQANTEALFYRKVRHLIVEDLTEGGS